MGPAGYKTAPQWFNVRGFNEGISYGGVDRVKGAFKRAAGSCCYFWVFKGKGRKAILQNPMRTEIGAEELPGRNQSHGRPGPKVLKQRGRNILTSLLPPSDFFACNSHLPNPKETRGQGSPDEVVYSVQP